MTSLHFSSASAQWNTPRSVIDRVIQMWGEIDCDPCSDIGQNVPARVHLTQEDDGLARPWLGNVYMNPPYGRGIGQWVEKAQQEYVDGRTDAVVMLLPARVDTGWWRTAVFNAHGFAIIRGRLTFSDFPSAAPFPSAVVYYGPDLDGFRKAFAPPFADCYEWRPTAYGLGLVEVAS